MTAREMGIGELRRGDTTGTVPLDARTRPAFASGHLPGEVNVPLERGRGRPFGAGRPETDDAKVARP